MQVNPNTGFSRPIAQVAEQPDVQWMYKDDKAVFMPYSSADSNTIENMYQKNLAQNLVINSKIYAIDFNQMNQINVSTQFKRAIERRSTTPASPSGIVPDLSVKDDLVEEEELEVPKDIVMTLRGPQDSLLLAEARIASKLKGAMKQQVIEALPKYMSEDLEKKIHNIAKKNEVEWCFEKKHERRVLKIEGVFFKVQAAVSAIQEEILTFTVNSESSDGEVALPPEWQKQSKTTELFSVVQGSAEWQQVDGKFASTMGNGKCVALIVFKTVGSGRSTSFRRNDWKQRIAVALMRWSSFMAPGEITPRISTKVRMGLTCGSVRVGCGVWQITLLLMPVILIIMLTHLETGGKCFSSKF